MRKWMLPVILLFMVFSCRDKQENRYQFEDLGQPVPEFSSDSAYRFIEEQVAFGPRNPGSEGHQLTKQYLLSKLRSYAGTGNVYPQEFTAQGYDGDTLALTNFIAAFNPQSSDRIMFCAHWDTRPRADKDTADTGEPILGADDGGSGVGLLLEMARMFKENPPPLGVDIIFFDGEDYGREGDLSRYFLGSRYWADNPPVSEYSPRFGILVDMVGGQGALFPKEQYSMSYDPSLVDEVWHIADVIGSHSFLDERGNAISDDHVIVSENAGIPTIDIIRHDTTPNGYGFPSYWHTHDDNMEVISRETLKEVGDVLAELIYNRVKSRS